MEKKFWLQVIGLLILIFGGLALTFNPGTLSQLGIPNISPRVITPTAQNQVAVFDSADTSNTSSPKAVFNVEVANTPELRKTGLGGRESLASNSGMLFVFDRAGKPSFWMKAMKFPIDIIWIKGSKIVDILQNVQPPSGDQADSALPLYAPVTEVDKVLEVNAGDVVKYGIKVGDRIK